MFRAFEGPNGWYVAWVRKDGFHAQPSDGGTMTRRQAERESKSRNAFCPYCGRSDGQHDQGYNCEDPS